MEDGFIIFDGGVGFISLRWGFFCEGLGFVGHLRCKRFCCSFQLRGI